MVRTSAWSLVHMPTMTLLACTPYACVGLHTGKLIGPSMCMYKNKLKGL